MIPESTILRWIIVLKRAGQIELAEQYRKELAARDERAAA